MASQTTTLGALLVNQGKEILPMKKGILSILLVLLIACLAMAVTEPSVSIKEWELPTKDSLPHDPAVAPDGNLWYTGMEANVIGRLNPKTGETREFPLPTPKSGPHGLVSDRKGNIWFTANYAGYIGQLDPQTGKISQFRMPDPKAEDPHTPVFDGKGILWFTVQNGNFVGKLIPETGEITLKQSPTKNSKPYGIVADSKGAIFYCEFGTNKIGRIDAGRFSISEYVLPKGARPRRIAVALDHTIYYTDYDRGYLGHIDPDKGFIEEMLSPGGEKSKPYGMTVTPDGAIWYSESGVKPNTIVRFDPAMRSFNRWNIPSGGGVVRNMVATPEGDIYIACSGVNKVGVVRQK